MGEITSQNKTIIVVAIIIVIFVFYVLLTNGNQNRNSNKNDRSTVDYFGNPDRTMIIQRSTTTYPNVQHQDISADRNSMQESQKNQQQRGHSFSYNHSNQSNNSQNRSSYSLRNNQ